VEEDKVASTQNIERLKKLRAFAAALTGACDRWAAKYADRKHYDKQGFGFTYRTDVSWNAFKVPALSFEAYVGTYGSSSCGNGWRIDEALVQVYFTAALNQHKQAIFDTMAAMATADADKLKGVAAEEIEALRALLTSAEAEASAEQVPA
jgi:hypothetical protein